MYLANGLVPTVVDTLHGVEVADPLRWLEDRTLPETEEWIADHQRKSDSYFDASPEYAVIQQELLRRLDIEVVDQPARVGEMYFFRRKSRGQERASIVVRDTRTGLEKILVAPDSVDRYISIGIYLISPNGETVAFYKQRGGSDKRSVHFVDVSSGCLVPIELPSGYLRGFVFAPKLKGAFYCQEQDGADHVIRFLSLTAEYAEHTVFACQRRGASKLSLTGDSETLGVSFLVEEGAHRVLDFWIATMSPTPKWTQVFARVDRSSFPLLHRNRLYLLRTAEDSGATLLECDLEGKPQRKIVPAQSGWILQIVFAGDAVYLGTQCGARTSLHEWCLSEQRDRRIDGFATGTVKLASVGASTESLFIVHEDYCQPPSIYEHSVVDRATKLWHKDDVPTLPVTIAHRSALAPNGVRIPVTLIHRRNAPGDAALVIPYGSFGNSVLPQYSAFMTLLLEMGFTLVIPHVRGGGEEGRTWHEAGRRRNKLTSVTDLICAVEQLPILSEIDPRKVALYGASGGGLLVAAAAMRSPALFRAVVSIGPLLDMLRYDKFGRARRWIEEFGTSEIEEDFLALYSYSPYHRIPIGEELPAFLFVTGDEDDRCDPAHVRKMAARLEDATEGAVHVLVDYSRHRGHAPGLPLQDRVKSLAKRCVFLRREMELPAFHGGRQ